MLNPPPSSHPEQPSLGIAEMGHDMVEEELQSLLSHMDRVYPSGVTPLTEHVHSIYDTVRAMAPSLNGKQVVVCLATDGMPTDALGYGGPRATQDFEQALRRLQSLPIWLVVRLCTDEQDVVDYYGKLDENLEWNMEVLDDFTSEAKEVHRYNPWLNYGLPLHRCREAGFRHRLFDLLDERALTREEMVDFLRLLLGDHEWKDPHVEWEAFVKQIRTVVSQEGKQWDPVRRRAMDWIHVNRLNSRYRPGANSVGVALFILVVLVAIVVQVLLA